MGKDAITNRGKGWEIINSWWILACVFLFNFVAFFYIGKTAKQKKWLIAGCVYLGIFILSVSVNSSEIGGGILMSGWLVSIIHAFMVRKQYLIRRDVILSNRIDEKEVSRMRSAIEAELNGVALDHKENDLVEEVEQKVQERTKKTVKAPADDFVDQVVQIVQERKEIPVAEVDNVIEEDMMAEEPVTVEKSVMVDESAKDEEANIEKVDARLDINNCSVEELEELPGMSVVQAKKADSYRKTHNGFFSVDEFFAVTELKPHFVVQVEDKLICGVMGEVVNSTPVENKEDSASGYKEQKEKRGRVLDI